MHNSIKVLKIHKSSPLHLYSALTAALQW